MRWWCGGRVCGKEAGREGGKSGMGGQCVVGLNIGGMCGAHSLGYDGAGLWYIRTPSLFLHCTGAWTCDRGYLRWLFDLAFSRFGTVLDRLSKS